METSCFPEIKNIDATGSVKKSVYTPKFSVEVECEIYLQIYTSKKTYFPNCLPRELLVGESRKRTGTSYLVVFNWEKEPHAGESTTRKKGRLMKGITSSG